MARPKSSQHARVSLCASQRKVIDLVDRSYPALANNCPCYLSEWEDWTGALDCKECNPFMQ